MNKLDWEIQISKETLVRLCKYKFAEDEVLYSQLKQVLKTLLILEEKQKLKKEI